MEAAIVTLCCHVAGTTDGADQISTEQFRISVLGLASVAEFISHKKSTLSVLSWVILSQKV